MTMRRSKTKMKEARKALETSSLGRKPRFRLSQLIQSVLMTRTTTDVREMRTVLQERGEERRGEANNGEEKKKERGEKMKRKKRKKIEGEKQREYVKSRGEENEKDSMRGRT